MTPVSTERLKEIEAVGKRTRALSFNGLTMQEHMDIVQAAFAAGEASLRASPTDGDDGVVDDLKSLAGRLSGNSQGILRDSIVISAAIDRISTQGKRLAELEGLVTDVRASALDDVSNITMRAEAAESALSTAEARALEKAAAWFDAEAARLIAENEAIIADGGWPDTNGRLSVAYRHRSSAAAIRALSTNEAGK